MRKKDLLVALQRARARIDALENIICPAHQHEWLEDHMDECYICRKCLKVRWDNATFD